MTIDDWRYIHSVLNNIAFISGRVALGKANADYVWKNEFVPLIQWLNEHDSSESD